MLRNILIVVVTLFPGYMHAQGGSIHVTGEIHAAGEGVNLTGELRSRLTGVSEPVDGGYVFALSGDGKRVLGYAMSVYVPSYRYYGRWLIWNLPKDTDIILFAFHPKTKCCEWALKKIHIGNENKDIGIIELEHYEHSQGPVEAPGIWGLLSILNWVSGEYAVTKIEQKLRTLADSLYYNYVLGDRNEPIFRKPDFKPIFEEKNGRATLTFPVDFDFDGDGRNDKIKMSWVIENNGDPGVDSIIYIEHGIMKIYLMERPRGWLVDSAYIDYVFSIPETGVDGGFIIRFTEALSAVYEGEETYLIYYLNGQWHTKFLTGWVSGGCRDKLYLTKSGKLFILSMVSDESKYRNAESFISRVESYEGAMYILRSLNVAIPCFVDKISVLKMVNGDFDLVEVDKEYVNTDPELQQFVNKIEIDEIKRAIDVVNHILEEEREYAEIKEAGEKLIEEYKEELNRLQRELDRLKYR